MANGDGDGGGEPAGERVARLYGLLRPHLDERQRRLLLGAEALELGRGGIKAVAQATGVHPDTVGRGVREAEGGPEPRVRAPGGGRKKLAGTDPGLGPALMALVEPESRGDPESPLRWTLLSTRNLAGTLTKAGHRCSAPTVARLLRAGGYSLQGNAKVAEGAVSVSVYNASGVAGANAALQRLRARVVVVPVRPNCRPIGSLPRPHPAPHPAVSTGTRVSHGHRSVSVKIKGGIPKGDTMILAFTGNPPHGGAVGAGGIITGPVPHCVSLPNAPHPGSATTSTSTG
jgi:hypothetical protein